MNAISSPKMKKEQHNFQLNKIFKTKYANKIIFFLFLIFNCWFSAHRRSKFEGFSQLFNQCLLSFSYLLDVDFDCSTGVFIIKIVHFCLLKYIKHAKKEVQCWLGKPSGNRSEWKTVILFENMYSCTWLGAILHFNLNKYVTYDD